LESAAPPTASPTPLGERSGEEALKPFNQTDFPLTLPAMGLAQAPLKSVARKVAAESPLPDGERRSKLRPQIAPSTGAPRGARRFRQRRGAIGFCACRRATPLRARARPRCGNRDACLVVAQQHPPYLPLVGRSGVALATLGLGGQAHHPTRRAQESAPPSPAQAGIQKDWNAAVAAPVMRYNPRAAKER
jgi:hypothetical protein